ncbi:purine-cytosine permease family protein [Thermogemmatispora onikobensis]|uniref:purine-cytosine permease family protein n=1 Tax=Thermogemmatispora onikobensis TaxID=732234 RepID=UPI00085358A6|nr:cytosine permease [Thermogemmatispora onikobensis]
MSVQQQRQPEADRPWAIELHGIDPIGDDERHGAPTELFWVWFAANIGILGIVYGGILTAAGLNLWQSLLVAVVGSAGSFVLVGVLSVAGKWGGAPMLTLSRAPFGTRGNMGPTLISWVSLVGWETITVITAAYALLGLLGLLGLPTTPVWTLVSLVVVALLVVLFGLLGHATLVWIQQAATWIFGLLTLVVVLFLLAKTDWAKTLVAPPGPWDSGVLATLSIVIAGTGIGWANAGADYTRYLPRASSGRAIVGWTVLGATLPLVVLMMTGVFLSSRLPNLTSATNPITAIGQELPPWMAAPYLLTAVGGLIASADLSIYSSGLNLLALGVRLERYKTVLIDGVLMVVGAAYVMLVAQDFFGPFESFLQLLSDGLTAWAAVFLVDMLLRRTYDAQSLVETGPGSRYYYRAGVNWRAVVAWLLGIGVGLLFTVSPWFTGPLARGIFASSSLGYLLGFVVSALVYWLLERGREVVLEATEAEPASELPGGGRSV